MGGSRNNPLFLVMMYKRKMLECERKNLQLHLEIGRLIEELNELKKKKLATRKDSF